MSAADLNLSTVELTSTLITAPLNGAPSSADYNDSQRANLVDLSTIVSFINNQILPLINALPAEALLPVSAPVGIQGATIWTNTVDQGQLFFDSLSSTPLTIYESFNILNGILTTNSHQLIDLGVEVASLQSLLASTNQNEISLALQNLSSSLSQLTVTQSTSNTAISSLQDEINILTTNLGAEVTRAESIEATKLTNVMTTTGDIIYSSPDSTPIRLGIGTNGYVLTAVAGVPRWIPSGGGGGSGSAGGSDTQVQYNNGGALAGDANFTWDFSNAFNPASSAPTPALILGPSGSNLSGYQSRLIVNDIFTSAIPSSYAGITSSQDIGLAGDQSSLAFAGLDTSMTLRDNSGSTHYGFIYCIDVNFSHQGTGLLDYVNGVYSTLSTNPGASVGSMISIYGTCGASGPATELGGGHFDATFNDSSTCTRLAGITTNITIDSGTVTNAYGIYIMPANNDGVITNYYGLYVDDLVGSGTASNAYAIYVAGGTSRFHGNVTLDNTLTDGSTSVGTFGQVLSSTGSGVAWISGGGAGVSVNPQSVSYTAVLGDANQLVTIAASPNTFTVPPNSSVAFPIGTTLSVIQASTGQTTLTPGAGVTINTPSSLTTRAQWSTVSVVQIATDIWVAGGDLT